MTFFGWRFYSQKKTGFKLRKDRRPYSPTCSRDSKSNFSKDDSCRALKNTLGDEILFTAEYKAMRHG